MKFQKWLSRIGAGSKLDGFAKNQGLNENLWLGGNQGLSENYGADDSQTIIRAWARICGWVKIAGGWRHFYERAAPLLKSGKKVGGAWTNQPLPFLRRPSGPIQCHQPSSTLVGFQTNKIRQTNKQIRPHIMPLTTRVLVSFQDMSTKYCDY